MLPCLLRCFSACLQCQIHLWGLPSAPARPPHLLPTAPHPPRPRLSCSCRRLAPGRSPHAASGTCLLTSQNLAKGRAAGRDTSQSRQAGWRGHCQDSVFPRDRLWSPGHQHGGMTTVPGTGAQGERRGGENQLLLSGGDLRLQLTSSGSPLPRQRQAGCIGMHGTRPPRDETPRNIPELSAHGARRLREDGRLLPVLYVNPEEMVACRMSSKASGTQKLHTAKPRVKPSSHRRIQTERAGLSAAVSQARGCQPPPTRSLGAALGFYSSHRPQGLTGRQGQLKASMFFLPRSANRKQPEEAAPRDTTPGVTHQGPADPARLLPSTLTDPAHERGHVQPITQLPQLRIKGGTPPTLLGAPDIHLKAREHGRPQPFPAAHAPGRAAALEAQLDLGLWGKQPYSARSKSRFSHPDSSPPPPKHLLGKIISLD